MKILLFHLMPYADLDIEASKNHVTCWATMPNKYYDPKKGHILYNRYLDELEYGEELGFDGVCVNEHHQTAYGLMPSPIVTASALSRRTSKTRIAILGSAIPLRSHPLMVAEEHAMIDNITGGRLITGFVRGIGAEYHVFGTNPTFSHERFHEAHDLIIRAWTEPGPFVHHGKHYHFEYVNVWPRIYQQPHPPIWIPSQGSNETIDFAAHPKHKYTYLQTFSPIKAVQKYLKQYQDVASQKYGYTAQPRQLGWASMVYVGETDESALREGGPHFEAFRNRFLKQPFEMVLPPGYTSRESMRGIAAAKSGNMGDVDAKTAVDTGMFVCGSAKTVRETLVRYARELGFGQLLTMLQFGTLPADLTRKNMERFARDVMPYVKREINAERGELAAMF